MDEAKVRDYAVNGGVVIFPELEEKLGVTENNFMCKLQSFEFGIDLHLWTVGPKFCGIKMIPSGFHIIHLNPSFRGQSSEVQVGKVSLVTYFEQRQVVPLYLDQSSEQFNLCSSRLLEHEIRALELKVRTHLREIDGGLAPYPFDGVSDHCSGSPWPRMTNFVTRNLLKRVFSTEACWVSPTQSCSYLSDVADSRLDDRISSDNRLFIKFTAFDLKRSYPSGSLGALRSKYSMDKSYLLTSLTELAFGNDYKLLLGELQLSFVLFLTAEFYDAFEQWKRLLTLICQSSEALESSLTKSCADSKGNSRRVTLSISFWTSLVNIILVQLDWFPSDFGLDQLSENNFILPALSHLLDTLGELELPHQLACASKLLEKKIKKVFGETCLQSNVLVDENGDQFFSENYQDRPTIV